MNWSKTIAITQIALFFLLILGAIYFNNKINEREEIFQHELDYVLEKYNLQSCSCIGNEGGFADFNNDSIRFRKGPILFEQP